MLWELTNVVQPCSGGRPAHTLSWQPQLHLDQTETHTTPEHVEEREEPMGATGQKINFLEIFCRKTTRKTLKIYTTRHIGQTSKHICGLIEHLYGILRNYWSCIVHSYCETYLFQESQISKNFSSRLKQRCDVSGFSLLYMKIQKGFISSTTNPTTCDDRFARLHKIGQNLHDCVYI